MVESEVDAKRSARGRDLEPNASRFGALLVLGRGADRDERDAAEQECAPGDHRDHPANLLVYAGLAGSDLAVGRHAVTVDIAARIARRREEPAAGREAAGADPREHEADPEGRRALHAR